MQHRSECDTRRCHVSWPNSSDRIFSPRRTRNISLLSATLSTSDLDPVTNARRQTRWRWCVLRFRPFFNTGFCPAVARKNDVWALGCCPNSPFIILIFRLGSDNFSLKFLWIRDEIFSKILRKIGRKIWEAGFLEQFFLSCEIWQRLKAEQACFLVQRNCTVTPLFAFGISINGSICKRQKCSLYALRANCLCVQLLKRTGLPPFQPQLANLLLIVKYELGNNSFSWLILSSFLIIYLK